MRPSDRRPSGSFPRVGNRSLVARVHPRSRPVPTCNLDDTVGVARQRAAAAGEDRCVVVTESGIVVGLLDRDALTGDHRAPAGDVMREGPTTIRAHEDLAGLARRMHDRDVTNILVTDPDGRLLGLLHRSDADAALDGEAQRPHQ